MNLIEFPYLMDLEGNNYKISNFQEIKKDNENFFVENDKNIKINNIILNKKQDIKHQDIIEINDKIYRYIDLKKENKNTILTNLEKQLKISNWNFEEREYLKKSLLSFGYARWDKIINSSDSILFKKKTEEIRAYSNAFIRSCIDNITYENLFLKNFLINILETDTKDDYIYVNYRDWDLNLIRQRANPWAKRIFFLEKLKQFMKNYEKFFFHNNNRYPENIFDYSDILNFLSGSILLGQRPTIWWTRNHDIDLIVSTYKYGYANYNIKGLDDDEDVFYDIPNSDSIIRRLKKLMQLINKESENKIDFSKKEEADSDLDNLSQNLKKEVFDLVRKIGIPLTTDLKQDWETLKKKLPQNINDSTLERLIHQLRIICNHIINDSIKIENQNIFIEFKTAQEFLNNSNLFHFFRKNVMKNKFNLFNLNLNDLKIINDNLNEKDEGFVKNFAYSVEIHDLGLIEEICKNGFYNFEKETLFIKNIQIDKNILLSRVKFLFNFFKSKLNNNSINKRKNNKTNKIIMKSAYIDINTLPCQVSSTLKLLNIGKIKPENNYHSEHNLFPIGFKTIRSHASPFVKGEKCDYECEILDGGEKPIFKLTCLEDPKNPIIKETSTGCWLHFCKLANEIADNKKYKVTISGTERFGLLEPAIIRLLEDLENSDKCRKYVFKSKKI